MIISNEYVDGENGTEYIWTSSSCLPFLAWGGLGILGKGLLVPSTKLGHGRRGHRLRLVAIAAGTKAEDESLKKQVSRKKEKPFIGLIPKIKQNMQKGMPAFHILYLPSWL